MKNIILLITTGLIASCISKSDNSVVGKWWMLQVIQNGNDVSSVHNPQNERFIIFKDDNSFESGGRPYGINTGKYEYNHDAGTLFLDSDSGPEDDSNWKITVSNDTMYWQGYGTEWAENFRIIQIKDN